MTADIETPNRIKLPKKAYEKIKRAVVELFKELDINAIPIDPFEIARQKGYILIPFSALPLEAIQMLRLREIDGTSFFDPKQNTFIIYYDDSACLLRQRFTIMHEIGHIILNHRADSELAEIMANYFAAYGLAPAPLIDLYKCEDFVEVAETFGVSTECAMHRFAAFERWKTFSSHPPYERQLLCLFERKTQKGGDVNWMF